MNRTVKKNLVMFIVFAMCISLFFSMKPLAVNANGEANTAVSGSGECSWVEINNGLYGGIIQSLAIDPTNTQIIYAGTFGGVFKSTNGGTSWSKTGLNGLTNPIVQSLAIDPTNTQIIYVGTWGGVFKSTDGGSSWTKMNNGLTNTIVRSLAIDPTNTQIVYAGTQGGVFKSTNGGASWTQMNNGLTSTDVVSLAIDPKNTQTIYAGTDGVFKSTDGGANWTKTGLTDAWINSLAIDPKNTQTIYAGTNWGGVFKSIDGGANWTKMNNGLTTNAYVYSLAIDPTNTQTIYAGTLGGVFKSTDGGTSWSETGLTNTYVESLVIDPANTQIIYAGTDTGVFKSTNGGTSWSETGLTDAWINSLAIDPTNTQIIYAGTLGGVFKSTNGGTSWSETGLTDAWINSLAIDPTNTQIIYAGTFGGGVFKSTCSSFALPSAPQNLKANASASSIVLNWDASTQGTYPIAGYAIYRGTTVGSESSTPIATVGASVTRYTDNNVTQGTTYYYYVKAFDNQDPANYSAPSNEVHVAVSSSQSLTITLKGNQFNLISFPFTVTSSQILNFVKAYTFDWTNSWTTPTTFEPGKGYWIKVSQDEDATLTSTPSSTDVTVTVTPNKFNLLGNPFNKPIDISALNVANGNHIIKIYTFDWTNFWQAWEANGTQEITTLEPGKGYWIELDSTASTTFTFPAP